MYPKTQKTAEQGCFYPSIHFPALILPRIARGWARGRYTCTGSRPVTGPAETDSHAHAHAHAHHS